MNFRNTGWCRLLVVLASAVLPLALASDSSGAPLPSSNLFPPDLASYVDPPGGGVWEILKHRAGAEPFNVVATVLFFLAIMHTFLAPMFQKLSHHYAREHQRAMTAPAPGAKAPVSFKAELFHFLGEIEAIFGIWVVPLVITLAVDKGWPAARDYIGHRNFVEPMFVVVIMTIAASRPVLELSERIMSRAARLGGSTPGAWWFSVLTLGPILGSFITEPAAMTISALLLAKRFYQYQPSARLAYATLGLLFVNISVGGTLTHFAAPPVLMVAGKWGWGMSHMFLNFGWKAALGIVLANLAYAVWFRRELRDLGKLSAVGTAGGEGDRAPLWTTTAHLLFLGWTVFTNHYPALFIGGFLFYLAFVQATGHHQSTVRLRPAMLVGFFLAGLVIHGGLQGWWIEPVLSSLSATPLYFSAIALTAFNDNAAIAYLASLVPDFGASLQYAVVAGAVTGGGLTFIANAPNPAGLSILARFFPEGVSSLWLFLGAAVPTAIMTFCFLAFR